MNMEIDKNNIPEQCELYKRVKNDIYKYGLSTFRRYMPSSSDGFKPIHRRIMYMMWYHNIGRSLIKVNKLTGLTLALHPHGDTSISSAIIKMGQEDITVNHSLLSPEGSFGSISDLSPSAPRYISVKVSDFGYDVLLSLMDQHTLEMVDAESDFGEKEPKYLPTRIPLVLINGGFGIAMSYLSSIPQHNLCDVVDISIKYIKNKNISSKELSQGLYPDYVVGGTIVNGDEIPQNYYDINYSSVIKFRGDAEIDQQQNQIIIRSMPVNYDFESLVESIKSVNEIKDSNGNPKNLILSNITFIGEKEDSNGKPYKFITCKNGTNLVEVLENLYKNTNLEFSDKMRMMLYCDDSVKICTIKDIVEDWYKVNYDDRERKIIYQINNNENKLHILQGLLKVYPNIDEIISIIRNTPEDRKSGDKKHILLRDKIILILKNKFNLSLIQARGIYDMHVGDLSRRSENDLLDSIEKVKNTILSFSNDLKRIDEIMINDLIDLKKKYGRPRRSKLIGKLAQREDITISNGAVLATRNSIGVFDSSNIISGKKILNGLKAVRIDNVWVRGIVDSHRIDHEISSILVFYENGSMHTVNPTILNSWIPNNNIEEDGFVKCVCPIYKNVPGSIICVTSDGMLKRFDTESLSSRISQSGVIVSRCIFIPNSMNESSLMIVNKESEYLHIKLSEIPVQGRTAQGVKSSLTNGDVRMTLIGGEWGIADDSFCLLMESKKLSEGYVYLRPIDDIKIGSRTNKLKKFHDFPDYICNGVGTIYLKDKDQIGLFVAEDCTSSLELLNLRNLKSPRKISCKAFDIISLSI